MHCVDFHVSRARARLLTLSRITRIHTAHLLSDRIFQPHHPRPRISTPQHRGVMVVLAAIAALATSAAFAAPSPQRTDTRQSNLKAIHKRVVEFYNAGNYAAALIEAAR